MTKSIGSFEKSSVDTTKRPRIEESKRHPTNEPKQIFDKQDDDVPLNATQDDSSAYLAALPNRIKSLTTEFGQILVSQEIEDDHRVEQWWQNNVSFKPIREHESYAEICLEDRRQLITSAISAVYLLSLLADKSQTQGLSSHIVKFVASTASKSVFRVFQNCKDALQVIQDTFLEKEIVTLKSLLVLALVNCFVIIAIVGEADAKENRKVNASACGLVLIEELADPSTPEDVKLQTISAFESVLQTSILTRLPWRSGAKSVLQELILACMEVSTSVSASNELVQRTHSLLVLLAWKNIKVTLDASSQTTEENLTSFEWLTGMALAGIDDASQNLYKVILEEDNEVNIVEHYCHKIERLQGLLIACLERGNRESDSSAHSTAYLSGPIIPMDRFFGVLSDLAKSIISLISFETSEDGVKKIRDLKPLVGSTLRLMRAVICRVESSRLSMAGEPISEFLEQLLILPRDPFVVIKLILYGTDDLANLLKTLGVRGPSILLRDSMSRGEYGTTDSVGIYVAQSVRTKVRLADRLAEQVLQILERLRGAILDIRNQNGIEFFEKITFRSCEESRFDIRLVVGQDRCVQAQELASACLRILSYLVPVCNCRLASLNGDLLGHVSWWLLTGLDSLLQSVHLRLTLRGLNSVTANLLSLREKNGNIMATMESMSIITYAMFQKDGIVYKTLLIIIRSVLGLDDMVPSILQRPKLQVSPLLEAVCTLVKLWHDVLNSDAFKLCVDEDGLALSRSLMNQICLRLVTGSDVDGYRFNGIEMDLNASVQQNSGELTLERSAADSPLLQDDQGLYLYQYDKGYSEPMDGEMSEEPLDSDDHFGHDDEDDDNNIDDDVNDMGHQVDDNDDEMTGYVPVVQDTWNSPHEPISFMTTNNNTLPYDDDDDEDDDEGESENSWRADSSRSSICEERSGVDTAEADGCLRDVEVSEKDEDSDEYEDASSVGSDYFMPRDTLVVHHDSNVTTIVDDDDDEVENRMNERGELSEAEEQVKSIVSEIVQDSVLRENIPDNAESADSVMSGMAGENINCLTMSEEIGNEDVSLMSGCNVVTPVGDRLSSSLKFCETVCSADTSIEPSERMLPSGDDN